MFVFFVEVVVGDVDRDRLSGTSIGAGSVIRPNDVKLSKAKQNLRFPRLVIAPLEQLSVLRGPTICRAITISRKHSSVPVF